MARILVVDDEVGIRELLSEILYDEGHTVELAENAAQARAARLRSRPDLVLLDIWMPDTDGVSLLKEWASQGMLDMPVIMMSGHATIDTAVEATRIGAMDFLEKPITLQRLLKTIAAGLARGRVPHPAAPALSAAAPMPIVALEDELDPAPVAPVVNGEAPVANTGQLGSISLDQPLREARDEFERIYFEYHLVRENHSMTRVSERTGLERTHLYRKLKQLGIESARKRGT
ncbi:two-component system response regulator [Bordetella genomosp. 5]|uniref:Two-component system response regulator n=1 Tax=Bordetella genomosp. 5 TaxID=1395608 RepID=A0A261T2C7_9BORD|nr:response regulator [Bordetella genomosp. 5]OZI33433.1 two-component system response regulator [Bordetella genomosp. 5]OZI42743.1 two-component system response regulator [Bordetella genomosp. 5]